MDLEKVRKLGPRGHYLAHEVGRLAGVSGLVIGQWARRGYIRSSQSEDTPRIYSFQDVAEAMVVHELLDSGVSHRFIKQAIGDLRQRHGQDWPLSHARLAIPLDDRAPGIIEKGTTLTELAPRTGQGVASNISTRDIATALNRGGWAAREIQDLQHIEIDPDRLSGRPAIRGTRVPAEIAGSLALTPEGAKTLSTDYDLNAEQILDARRWWEKVRYYETAA